MKKEDIRVQKTKRIIKESFIELVEQLGYYNVSVVDIVKKANINRNTFYLHYESKDDLIRTIIKEASDKVDNSLKDLEYLSSSDYERITETHLRWGFRKLFKILENDVDLYRIVLLDNALTGYIEFLSDKLKKHLAESLKIKNSRSSIIFEYSFSGLFGVIKQWIIFMPTSIYEASNVTAHMVYTNLRQFSQTNKNKNTYQ